MYWICTSISQLFTSTNSTWCRRLARSSATAAEADYNSRSFLSQLFFSSHRTRTNSVFFQVVTTNTAFTKNCV